MARKQDAPKKNAKTIPQKIARKELIEGGVAEKERKRKALIEGKSAGGGAIPQVSSRQAGVLARNVRGEAPTRRGDQKEKVNKSTRQGRRKGKKVDVNDPKDLKFLANKEKDRVKEEKAGDLKPGQTIFAEYYGKEREGIVVKTLKQAGVTRDVLMKLRDGGKEVKINARKITVRPSKLSDEEDVNQFLKSQNNEQLEAAIKKFNKIEKKSIKLPDEKGVRKRKDALIKIAKDEGIGQFFF
jgi:hypothetical protein